jgi:hypothetical protein
MCGAGYGIHLFSNVAATPQTVAQNGVPNPFATLKLSRKLTLQANQNFSVTLNMPAPNAALVGTKSLRCILDGELTRPVQ